MRTDVVEFVQTCSTCQRNKASNQKPAGLLQSLSIPQQPWESISLDFVTQLPETARGNTQIVVYVDRLTKQCHLSPLPTNATAVTVAQDFITNIFRLHGLPLTIVSDRDAKFTSHMWQDIMRLLGTKICMSTAFHPQTDGQTERMNRVMEDMMRHLAESQPLEWDHNLPLIEFAINNAYSASVQSTPFRLNHGHDPLTPLGIMADTNNPQAHHITSNIRGQKRPLRLLETDRNRPMIGTTKSKASQ